LRSGLRLLRSLTRCHREKHNNANVVQTVRNMYRIGQAQTAKTVTPMVSKNPSARMVPIMMVYSLVASGPRLVG
jgi:hypothetical protein